MSRGSSHKNSGIGSVRYKKNVGYHGSVGQSQGRLGRKGKRK